tara:strand:+ start:505 stop:906 length:402 start_codon:yes stop_codon:yes gene_type:complete
MIKQLLKKLLKIKTMQTTNRQSMERYAAKTAENTREVYMPRNTVIVEGGQGIKCVTGHIYKIYAIKTSTIEAAASDWDVKGAAGTSGAGLTDYSADIKLAISQEILGRFKTIKLAAGSSAICYAAAGTSMEVL